MLQVLRQNGNATKNLINFQVKVKIEALQTYCCAAHELPGQQRSPNHIVILRLKGGIYPLLKSIPSEVQMNTWQQRIEDHISWFSRFNDHWLRGLFTPAFKMNQKVTCDSGGGPSIGELACDVSYYYQGKKQETDQTK